ncbi:hypothetical protein [Taklimakanibacter deserti]|uniref:hypothetical protein n=1 Tax=Taklimakanibacter deserti TaxID=2267839 RepID=UPI0013C497F3
MLLLLAGCTKTLPDNYSGPTAVVKDTYANYVEGGFFRDEKVDLFVMQTMDGKLIDNGQLATARASFKSSLGIALKPQAYERRVPIRPMTIGLAAIISYAAGGQYGGSREPQTMASRKVKFNPVAGETYVVRGRIARDNSAVWLETASGRIVSE